MLTGEVKQRLIAVLSEIVARHQRARAQVTEEVYDSICCLAYWFLFYQYMRAMCHFSLPNV